MAQRTVSLKVALAMYYGKAVELEMSMPDMTQIAAEQDQVQALFDDMVDSNRRLKRRVDRLESQVTGQPVRTRPDRPRRRNRGDDEQHVGEEFGMDEIEEGPAPAEQPVQQTPDPNAPNNQTVLTENSPPPAEL